MDFKQKAEEKKMSMSKNIARLAVTAGLTAALSFGGVMAPVTMAFAEGSSTVTFEDPDYAASTTYKGIQIFKATVAKTGENTTVSGIEWAGADADAQKAIQDAVVKAIQSKDSNYSSTYAQDAADYLNANAGVSSSTEQVKNDNVLSQIAANLEKSTGLVWKETSTNSNQLSDLSAGYWLFLTNAVDNTATDKSTDTFSAPVYAVIDGKTKMNVTPKKDVPTVDKKILDGAADVAGADIKTSEEWKDFADSQIGQEVNYKLTGTIASNYATYDNYAYKFTDNLSSGLDYVNDSVKVYAFDGSGYTEIQANKYKVSCVDNKLTVEFKVGEGKKGLKDVEGVDASTKIVVFYKAKLNSNAVIGNAKDESGNFKKGGNPNTVKLEYSNNPYGTGEGTTVEHTVADFAFKLNLKKVDQGTEKGLENAVFTIQSADKNTKDQYIASAAGTVGDTSVVEGQLVTVPSGTELPDCVKFTSRNDGMIVVSGLDAGSYKVHEVSAPNKSYTTAADFTFTIKPTYTTNGTLNVDKLEATLDSSTRGDVVMGELDGNAGDNVLNAKNDTAAKPATGEINITVGNTKSVGLPLTGLNGVTFTWIAGGAVLCIGVAHLIRSRKQAEESEQE